MRRNAFPTLPWLDDAAKAFLVTKKVTRQRESTEARKFNISTRLMSTALFHAFGNAAVVKDYRNLVVSGGQIMALETQWLHSWISGVGSSRVLPSSSSEAEELASERLHTLFGETGKTEMKTSLTCIFTASSVSEVVWFGIAYIAEVANFLRHTVCAKQEGFERMRLWSETYPLITYKLSKAIERLLSPLQHQDAVVCGLRQWGDVVCKRVSYIELNP